MNNTDFRHILLQGEQSNDKPSTTTNSAFSLGRSRPQIALTPRTVRGQSAFIYANPHGHNGTTQSSKQFRSKTTPKGSKLATGYTDRVSSRNTDTQEDERESRLKALEEQVKLGQIDRHVFEELRDQITGGDIAATHLIKGLDRRLLERVRKGEDVLGLGRDGTEIEVSTDAVQGHREDEELEQLEQREIGPLERKTVAKKGERASQPAPVTGTKRSRNDILAELKASREASTAVSAEFQLGSRFHKVGSKKAGSRTEKDEYGREVLITVDEDGRVKRKVRRMETPQKIKEPAKSHLLPIPSSQPLGMFVPAPVPQEKDLDFDIFENVGTEYNPLGDAEVSDDSSSDEESKTPIPRSPSSSTTPTEKLPKISEPTAISLITETATNAEANGATTRKMNYFSEAQMVVASAPINPLHDPTLVRAIKRAATIAPQDTNSTDDATGTDRVSGTRHRLLDNLRDRDLDDLDLGFGSSRFEDQDEEGESGNRRLLSEWKDNLEGKGDGGRGSKDKRQSKRRGKSKGNKQSTAADIFKVIEQRKAGAG